VPVATAAVSRAIVRCRLWWEKFVKEVGLELEVKERGSYG